jgi:Asp-tRNA(Asn)/Glu-tRNA(Gln) amidotransferase A subunit family amidase
MRPTAGLVSRTGVFNGWPTINGSLGPMARTVRDLAILLDVMVGYDPDDPITSHGVGKVPGSYTKFLNKNGLKGARIGVLRESIGSGSKPGAKDFEQINVLFDKAVAELKAAGAVIVDPIVIPNLKELLAKRAGSPTEGEEAFKLYFGRSTHPPFKSRADAANSPLFAKINPSAQNRLREGGGTEALKRYYEGLEAREELMTNLLKVMADNKLDAIVHRSVEHEPTPLEESRRATGGGNNTGAPHLNTFLVFVPSIAVPAGFSNGTLPGGITFLGRPYTEGALIKFAYAYEQATHHRKPPESTPELSK